MKQLIVGSILLANMAVLILLVYDMLYQGHQTDDNKLYLILSVVSFVVIGYLSLKLNVFLEAPTLSG